MLEVHETELDFLAVGAHPDDVEIACGGTLARLARKGYRVGIVDLTDGEPTPLSPGPDVRAKEAMRAAEILGVHVRLNLNLPNRRLFDSFEHRVALAKVFRQYRPKLVVGFGGKTVMASPDHYQAMLITDAAVFYSRLTKWDEHFDGLPVHAVLRQLYFRLAVEPDLMPGESSHITVDIAATLDAKIASIMCYQTQFAGKPYMADRVRAAAVVSGGTAGVSAGEVFVASRPFAVDDLLKTIM